MAMASTSRISSFTITQPFLGAPLQFQPVLGSQELDELVNAYVAGSGSKQDKLSEVTIDFYNRATVDLSNGALVRRYDVVLPSRALGQSPTQSQSSGFSPPIYTPSPGSSATFGDSGNTSTSMTPPSRSRQSRVSKKALKKETKKTAELRLPGFSIMTKDGVDVTSSAGRGTKTKEQREHAHMMRIMKACDDCKRKKVRCDASHRRANAGPSTSASTTKTSSPTTFYPSPPAPKPSSSREAAPPPSHVDFVLFPESSSSWNPADMPFSEFDSQECDLANFDFDLSEIELTDIPSWNEDRVFDFSLAQQPGFEIEPRPSYIPLLTDQYGLDQWAEPQGFSPIYFSEPLEAYVEDSEQLGSKPYMRSRLGVESSERSPARMTASMTVGPEDYDFVVDFSKPPEPPIDHLDFFGSPLGSGSCSPATPSFEWSAFDSNTSLSSETESSSPEATQTPTVNRIPRSSGWRRYDDTNRPLLEQDVANYFKPSQPSLDSSEHQHPVESTQSTLLLPTSHIHGKKPQNPPSSTGSSELLEMERTCSVLEHIVRAFRSAPTEHRSLSGELQRLRHNLAALKYSYATGFSLDCPDSAASLLQGVASQLQVLVTRIRKPLQAACLSDLEQSGLDPEFVKRRLWQVNARRLDLALCAAVANLQQLNVQLSPPGTGNSRVLTSSRNRQLVPSPTDRHSSGMRLNIAPVQTQSTLIALPLLATVMFVGLAALADSRKQCNEDGQLETAGLFSTVTMLAGIMTAHLAILPTVARLGFQVVMFMIAVWALGVGHGSLATATDPVSCRPTTQTTLESISRTPQLPSSAPQAVVLPLSTSSSGSLVSSTKHTLSKHFRRPEASHWLGMLRRLRIGSSVL